MKKIIVLLLALLPMLTVSAQTMVNSDGTLKFRGNVAIIVKGSHYTFMDGKYAKQVDDEATELLKTSLRTFYIREFQNLCFAVVNRDDTANEHVKQLIEENKLEDYLGGISIQAKNQGADYLFVVDVVSYGEENSAAQFFISSRLINIENNLGYHFSYISEAMNLSNDSYRDKIHKAINDIKMNFQETLLALFPEQYYVAKADGKNWHLAAYQPNGAILTTDKFYAFKFEKTNMKIGNNLIPIQVLDNVAVADFKESDSGYIKVRSNTAVDQPKELVLFRNSPELKMSGTNQMAMTFFGFNYDFDSYDGLIKYRINNAVYSAITYHPGSQIIEHDHLKEIREERELQKTEDFIDGHVVEQMKAIGAQYLIHIENYQRDGMLLTFDFSLVSVAANKILRTVQVKTSIDNIEKEMYKQLCQRIAYPCVVKELTQNKIELTSVLSLTHENDCILQVRKQIKNPVTGELSYTTSDLCSLSFEKYHGNKTILSVSKVFNKEDMKLLEEYSALGTLTFRIDANAVESDDDSKSEVQQKAPKAESATNIQKEKKKSSFLKGLKDAGKQLINNINAN